MAEKQTMVVGIDDSEQSNYALQWTLRHFFSSPNPTDPLFRLVIVHAKRPVASVVPLVGPGGAYALAAMPAIKEDLKKTAASVIEKAREICVTNQVNDAIYEVYEGDPRYVLCETAEKYQADMLVVGSHGHGAIKRAVLGERERLLCSSCTLHRDDCEEAKAQALINSTVYNSNLCHISIMNKHPNKHCVCLSH